MVSDLEHRLSVAGGSTDLLAVAGGVERPELVVLAHRVADLAVRLDRDAVDRVLMVWEGQHRFLRGQVPNFGGLVAASGEQMLAVRGDGDAEDPVGMVFDGLFQLGAGDAASDVPNADDTVATAGGQLLAVRADGEAEHGIVRLD